MFEKVKELYQEKCYIDFDTTLYFVLVFQLCKI